MSQQELAVVRVKQYGRLSGTGHLMTWRKLRSGGVYAGSYHRGTCRRCGGQVECYEHGPAWRAAPGRQSLLKWPGVNVVRRCLGKR
jgi:hypothetical protein